MTTHSSHTIAQYYDRNTRRFLMVGGSGSSYSIHRQLWGPGVRTTRDASEYINHLIAERIGEVRVGSELTILDMGCGVGGTLFHLALAFPHGELHGITISATQHDIANRISTQKGLEGRCHVHLGDFQSERLKIEADSIVAVESFVHAESLERFFVTTVAHLKAGGHLMLADDFLTEDTERRNATQLRQIADFKAGWRVPSLCSVDECVRVAAAVGLELVSNADLTPLIRLGRPRDRAIAILAPLFRALGLASVPFFGNMIGGGALQAGLADGLFSYRFLVFRKSTTTV